MTTPDAAAAQTPEHTLPATISLDTTLELLTAMRAAGPKADLVFDAGAVEQMCTPFVLTLVAALNERAGCDAAVQVRNPTAAFTDAFTDLGLFSDMMKLEFAT